MGTYTRQGYDTHTYNGGLVHYMILVLVEMTEMQRVVMVRWIGVLDEWLWLDGYWLIEMKSVGVLPTVLCWIEDF
jgi:hypothetical protein